MCTSNSDLLWVIIIMGKNLSSPLTLGCGFKTQVHRIKSGTEEGKKETDHR